MVKKLVSTVFMALLISLALIVVMMLTPWPAYAADPFTVDITATNVLTGVFWGSVAWGDYDNDRDLDILLTGGTDVGNRIASVYRNTGGAFSEDVAASSVLSGVFYSSVAWGDYDNDGDLDILLAGRDDYVYIASVYKNTGGAFSEDVAASSVLTGVDGASVAWGDYDNDGDLDILLTGYPGSPSSYITKVYRNTGGAFSEDVAASSVLTGVAFGSVAWGDYDNDGDLDILSTGSYGPSLNPSAIVYQNTGGAFAVDITATNVLTGVFYSSVAWGDYDNDGDLDILLTGYTDGIGSNCITAVYRNTGGAFSEDVTATNVLTDACSGSVAWGDYDNDGDLDILLTGWAGSDNYIASVYRNTSGAFGEDVAATNVLTGVWESSVAWGDYDNDGDLDILLTGHASIDPLIDITAVYRNNLITTTAPYIPPAAPTDLSAAVTGRTVELRWAAPPPTCTTPITALSYNLRVGTASGKVDVAPPMALTAPLTDGYRLVPQWGNAQHGLTATLVLPCGTYSWTVQAVDHTFAGSPFAAEGSFAVRCVYYWPLVLKNYTSAP